MKGFAFVAATMALAAAASPAEPRAVSAGDPVVATDITIPVILPVPGTSILAVGNVTATTYTNGTLLLQKLIGFPGIGASTTGGIDINIASSMGLKQQDSAHAMEPLDPEADIDIGTSVIDVRINGVNGNTAVDIFF